MAGLTLQPGEKDLRKIVDVIRQLTEGKNNATGTFTLTASATTTTVDAPSCTVDSVVLPFATTAHAANDFGLMWITAGNAQFTVNHANNSRNDRTFAFVVMG